MLKYNSISERCLLLNSYLYIHIHKLVNVVLPTTPAQNLYFLLINLSSVASAILNFLSSVSVHPMICVGNLKFAFPFLASTLHKFIFRPTAVLKRFVELYIRLHG